MEDWEMKYINLRARFERLERENESLRNQLRCSEEAKEHAEYRIITELEPMLKARRDAYDRYVTNPEME